ncbi:hypothetical protein CSOJ01_02032 [Colletotrichum sojae]|uniref:Uncharacterized protein n=1 Tax=Colletotrichum sojae TaxID=2175907 RepID=A0A8H6JSR0_9PEZI|nr:hypothetical protein CSOJ01_02032 [Colletotrichum sojae]
MRPSIIHPSIQIRTRPQPPSLPPHDANTSRSGPSSVHPSILLYSDQWRGHLTGTYRQPHRNSPSDRSPLNPPHYLQRHGSQMKTPVVRPVAGASRISILDAVAAEKLFDSGSRADQPLAASLHRGYAANWSRADDHYRNPQHIIINI